MFTKALLLLLYSSPLIVFSQPITWIHGARTAALANAGTALEGSWTTSGNPAGMARVSSPAAAIALERRFLLEDLDSRAATAVIPIRRQVLGLNLNAFGGELYRRYRISFSIARALSRSFRLGVAINYHGLKITGYPAQAAWSVTVGAQCTLLPGMTAGLFVSNPNKARFNEVIKEALPVTAALATAWTLSEKVLGVVALKRISGVPPSVRCGLEYLPHPALAIRAGASTAPFRQYGGLGLVWRRFHLDMAVSSHLQLGLTPQISIGYGR